MLHDMFGINQETNLVIYIKHYVVLVTSHIMSLEISMSLIIMIFHANYQKLSAQSWGNV